ncbi:class I SAM-dependent methyltransferase [Nesterenkonia marinintestina]|uniref:class I SAM-dependent methyltransferase n=1 Tax=Nesterenkonia marinintestina TaxID=2979865 RepID=UPI0021BE18C8|nr:class I SAM-dependent methyltransferase [Nesterenkonia sp. GX14115]
MTESRSGLPPAGTTPEVVPGRLAERARRDPELSPDAADLLLLDTAEAWLLAARAAGAPIRRAVVVDDRTDSLVPALEGELPETSVGRFRDEDPRTAPLDADLLTGAELVLMPLPRSLDALDEWAQLIAQSADPRVVLLAGGRDKHMNRSMNEVLARRFADLVPGRGRSRSRVLTARSPRQDVPAPAARRREHEVAAELGLPRPLTLCAVGSVYGGTSLDPGTRLMLATVLADPDLRAEFETAAASGDRPVDLGCGNGTVAAVLALRFPGLSVLAVDRSASAVGSAHRTAHANGVSDRIEVLHDDGLLDLPAASHRLILLNPPFHRGNAVDVTVAHELIARAGRALAPGGRLVCVWNSHLRHRRTLESAVGPTEQLARNPKFTVTVSTRRTGHA